MPAHARHRFLALRARERPIRHFQIPSRRPGLLVGFATRKAGEPRLVRRVRHARVSPMFRTDLAEARHA